MKKTKDIKGTPNSAGNNNKLLLSIVLQGRNDAYMGNFDYRLSTNINKFARNIFELGFEGKAEIILNDWGSEKPLVNILTLTNEARSLLKIIQTPPDIAKKYDRDSRYSCVHAINVGIRNSIGKYILFCDGDTYTPLETMRKLFTMLNDGIINGQSLDNLFILGSRYHIPKSFQETKPSLEEIDSFISGSKSTLAHDKINLEKFLGTSTAYLMTRDMWFRCRGFDENLIYWGWFDIDLFYRLTTNYKPLDFEDLDMPFFHLEHYSDSNNRNVASENPQKMNTADMPASFAPNDENWGLLNENLEIVSPEAPVQNSQSDLSKSELSRVIPPEIKNDDFYFLIKKLAKEEKIKTVLEIGSSAGGGSTEAFVTGLRENPNKPLLFCMEISKPRFAELNRRYESDSFVKCYNVSSVSAKKFPTKQEVSIFYNSTKTALNNYPLERVLGWMEQDIEYVNKSGVPSDGIQIIKRENKITHFDMVLIDGSEFTGNSELNEVYGAKFILLDDINGFKNFSNFHRLSNDPDYQLLASSWNVRNGYAIFKRNENTLPIHFFTIVLNGEPFIRHHIEVFRQLPFKWHWHIIEGVADLKHDTAWSVQNGGRITDELHKNGLSNDGTSEYLDELQKQHPGNITVYRKLKGEFWDGKLEMVSAPLSNINEECLLWQVDSDELWTIKQLCDSRTIFLQHPEKTAAYYYCYYFVGENLVIITRDTYGNHSSYEWLRTWRFKPGDKWLAHEPPRLCRQINNGEWTDLSTVSPFRHNETEDSGLIFQHFPYVLEEQLRFKELYYGYKGAVSQWQQLQQQTRFPVMLRDYFDWVKDHAEVDTALSMGIQLIAQKDVLNQWHFKQHNLHHVKQQSSPKPTEIQQNNILWIRTDSIGDNVLSSSMLPYIRKKYNNDRITVVCQKHIAELYEACPYVDGIIAYNRKRILENEWDRNNFLNNLRSLNPFLALNSVYSREILTDFLTIESGAKEKIALYGDFANISSEHLVEGNKFYTRLLKSKGKYLPEIKRHEDFLKGIGVESPNLSPFVWLMPEDIKFAETFFDKNNLKPERTIALFAGAQQQIKNYEGYGSSLSRICKDNSLTLIALGGGKEYKINQTNLHKINSHTINLCGKTTLRQTSAILKHCRLAVGADTSLAHIACAVGTPNVVLLGGGHFGRFMPYSQLTSVVCLPLDCYGCNWQCDYKYAHCIRDIQQSVLAEAVKQTLDKTSKKPRVFYQDGSLWQPDVYQPEWQMFDRFLDVNAIEIIPVGSKESAQHKKAETSHLVSPPPLNSRFMVSALVSTYNSEKFIQGCLEDLEAQTIADKLEIIVVDSGSQQNEWAIVKEFQKRHDNIVYIRTEERETIYAAWNRAIKTSKGKYITNANTDDRRRNDALEVMSRALDENPRIPLVYGDCYLALVPNQTYEENPKTRLFKYPDYYAPASLLHYQFGPQPMWRRDIHDEIGYFDESFKAIGDYDFNIRFALEFHAMHISQPLGLYLKHDGAASFRDDSAAKEMVRIREKYRTPEIIKRLYHKAGINCGSNEVLSRALTDLGRMALEFYPPWEEGASASDRQFAEQCFRWASEFSAAQSSGLNILFVVHSFPPHWFGGVETYTYNLVKALIAKGHSVTVIYPRIKEDVRAPFVQEGVYDGIKTKTLFIGEKGHIGEQIENPEIERVFVDFLNINRFDVVHFQHTHWFPFSLINIAKDLNLPVCLTLHDFWFICPLVHMYREDSGKLCSGPSEPGKCAVCMEEYSHWNLNDRDRTSLLSLISCRHDYVRSLLQRMDIVTVPSKYLAEQFALYKFAPERMLISPFGISLSPQPTVLKETGEITFGYIGSIHALKNTIPLANAFAEVTGKAKLIFWGNGHADKIAELKHIIESNSRIEYRGEYTPADLPGILSGLDIVIVPSNNESYCFTVREALSAGVPVIASNVGGIPEIVTHMKNGILFDPLNKEELRARLQEIVDNPSIIEKLKKGITPIKTIEEDVEEWIDRYRALASGVKKSSLSEGGGVRRNAINAKKTAVIRDKKIFKTAKLNDSRLHIPSTTLVCIDCINHDLSIKTIKHCMNICNFDRTIFFTDRDFSLDSGIDVIKIPPISTKEEYSRFVIKELNNYIHTDFALMIQYDGFIINPDAWTDEFLKYDYIGAKWHWYNDGFNVGNGGFSMRSKRLMQALSDESINASSVEYGEDTLICRTYRSLLENKYGIRFAPEHIADRFSYERSDFTGNHPFGFHGLFNMWRYLKPEHIPDFISKLSPKTLNSIEALEFGMNWQRLGQTQTAEIIYSKILEFNPGNVNAMKALKQLTGAVTSKKAGRNEPCPCGSGKKYKKCCGGGTAARSV